MINQYIAWLDVAVDDALRMRVVEADKDLKHISADVLECELGPQSAEVSVLDVLEDKAGRTGRRIGDYVRKIDDKWPTL